jgi:hypothetical protein
MEGLKASLTVASVACALLGAAGSRATTVDYSINELAEYSSATAPAAGSASATLTISDIAANEVQVTLTADLTVAGTAKQDIVGLWLNLPDSAGALTVGSPSGPATPVSVTQSATQTLVPGGANSALTGFYDVDIKLPNGTGGALQGTATESFTLTGAGLTASEFVRPELAHNSSPSQSYYAMIAVDNLLGSAGSGTGYYGAGAPSVVPLPGGLALMVSGLGGLAALAVRRRRPSTARFA